MAQTIPGYTDEQLAMLTEEELAGLKELIEDEAAGDAEEDASDDPADANKDDDEDAAPETDAGAGGDDDADKNGAEDGGEGGDEPSSKAAVEAKPEAEDDPVEEDGASAAQQPQKGSQFPDWQAPENADERLTEINSQLDEIADQFDEGDLTAKEYRQQIRELENERDGIKEARLKATMAADMTKHSWEQDTVPNFLGAHPGDYPQESMQLAALDREVRRLQTAALAGGNSQFDPNILEQAHALVQKQVAALRGGTPARAAAEKGDNGGKAGPDRPSPPPTLAHAPAADAEDTGAGEFGHLDRLTGTEYEAALAEMPEAKRERYLQQG